MTDLDQSSETQERLDRQQALADLEQADSLVALDQVRLNWLGRKGKLTQALKGLGKLPPDQRSELGEACNALKKLLLEAIPLRRKELEARQLIEDAARDSLDIGLSGRHQFQGSCHPVSDMTERVVNFFVGQSFQVVFGSEVEDDDHNFRSLNFAPDHPARTMHDSFYLERELLLRTHTSSVQIRYMKQHRPPVRIIAPGRVYRRDHDLTHSPMFTQIEGLVIDRKAPIGELLAVLDGFVQYIFDDPDLRTRYRPSYFPFTEPSLEMDIACLACSGKGCRVCAHTGWLEVLGCGMVHPAVLENVGVNPNEYCGYAFGLGIERIAMLLHGIGDLRLLFENHLGFLDQFQPG